MKFYNVSSYLYLVYRVTHFMVQCYKIFDIHPGALFDPVNRFLYIGI